MRAGNTTSAVHFTVSSCRFSEQMRRRPRSTVSRVVGREWRESGSAVCQLKGSWYNAQLALGRTEWTRSENSGYILVKRKTKNVFIFNDKNAFRRLSLLLWNGGHAWHMQSKQGSKGKGREHNSCLNQSFISFFSGKLRKLVQVFFLYNFLSSPNKVILRQITY